MYFFLSRYINFHNYEKVCLLKLFLFAADLKHTHHRNVKLEDLAFHVQKVLQGKEAISDKFIEPTLKFYIF